MKEMCLFLIYLVIIYQYVEFLEHTEHTDGQQEDYEWSKKFLTDMNTCNYWKSS